MSDRAPVVAARGVTRVLGGAVPATLVRDVDVEVAPGEFVAVTGPSGSGKSSLLYLLGLLDRPTRGRVLFDGVDTAGLGGDALAALRLARIGFVFQFHFLLPELGVLDNVALPMRRLGRLAAAGAEARALALLARLGLADHARKSPQQLSGGQRQRVAIARALANDPALVLADEPTGNLDSASARVVFDVFAALAAEEGRAVVVVTHDEGLARRATRRLRMVDGAIVPPGGPPARTRAAGA
ncbi:MAG: lipoprotein-releasing system transporter, ATP-binding protein lolD [Pseudomonadota bacterium]|jgi:lipoprotein-releasing system ATP-binding protein